MGNPTSFAFVKMAIDLAKEDLLPQIAPIPPETLNIISRACGVEPSWQNSEQSSSVARLLANVHLHIYISDPWSTGYVRRPFSTSEQNIQLTLLSQKLSRYAQRNPDRYPVNEAKDIYQELCWFARGLKADGYGLFLEK